MPPPRPTPPRRSCAPPPEIRNSRPSPKRRSSLMPTTADNLKTAFAGESQANRKYLAYAMKAEKEGYPQIAKLFRAAAEAETIHALAHFQSMGGVGSTLENVQAAIAGET